MNNLHEIKKRKHELLNHLEQARHYKAKTIKFVNDLEHQLNTKKISKYEFDYRLNKGLAGKSHHEWVSYYNDLIEDGSRELHELNLSLSHHEKSKNYNLGLLIVLILVLGSIVTLVFFKPEITGLVVYQPESTLNELVTLTLRQNITLENATVTAKLNNQEVNLPLSQFEIVENLVNIDTSKFNIKAEEGTLFVVIIQDANIVSTTSLDISLEEQESIPQENITEEIIPVQNITEIKEEILPPPVTNVTLEEEEEEIQDVISLNLSN